MTGEVGTWSKLSGIPFPVAKTQWGTMTSENEKTDDRKTEQLHLSSQFTRAVDYARHIHIERRKGTDIPYMAHLLGVASLVMGEAGHAGFPVSEEMVIAVLLHDAVEDQGGLPRLKDIEQNFGPNVARMVEGLSDSVSEDSSMKKPWSERKHAYIQRLRDEPADVQLISAADKLYNARAILEDYREIGLKVWGRFKRGRDEQLRYLDELLAVYKSTGMGRIVGELERVVNELRQISAEETH
ncbi:MAG TPA: HD domain-containing protein [Terracidiphilus sp.]|nr:HD domain-containing protein [Terracidiphilus sp.]HVC45949.1 HD domain-containing protein [Terracidiphilus sp.]